MSQNKRDVLQFDLDYSAYEHLQTLHDRSRLENVKHNLDLDGKIILAMYDLILLKKAKEMAEQISSVYDFSLSDKNQIPLEHWWWHLDKVGKGILHVEYHFLYLPEKI